MSRPNFYSFMGIYEKVAALVGRTTQEFKAQKPFLNTVANQAAVTAYNGGLNRLLVADGSSYDYLSGSTLAPVGSMILAATGKGSGRWLKRTTRCNVMDFGADNMASTDSSAAINAAIAYAKSFTGMNGGLFRYNINFAAGWYLILNTVDVTNANGVYLVGSGGSYINTGFICCTSKADGSGQGIGFDFTGSIRSGMRHFSITFDSAWGNIASKIGVQFALSTDAQGNQIGGLNCTVSDLFIQAYDSATLNGGAGTIGILNVRAEEFAVTDCYIKANAPVVFSNTSDLSSAGMNYTVTSPNAIVATTPNGSMGVVDCSGQNSFLSIQKRQAAITLINANSFRFHGYLARQVADTGAVETAVRLVGQCDNITVSGTIESFSQVLRTGALSRNLRFDIVTANQITPTTAVYDFTGTGVKDSHFTTTFTVPSEYNNGRFYAYHSPVDNGASPATGSLVNCTLSCSEWVDNTKFVSPNLLKNSQNSRFNSGQPFIKRNSGLVDLKNYPIPLGSIANGNPDIVGQLIRFTKADRANTNANLNGGYYHAIIRGVVRSGIIYQTGGNVVAEISGSVLLSMNANNNPNGTSSAVSILTKSLTSAAYIDITGVSLSLDLSGQYGRILLTVKNSGTGVNEPLVFVGSIELVSDFAVNQSIIFH